MEHLKAFFNETCLIEERIAGYDSFHAPTNTWQTVPGRLPIPCRVSPVEGGVRMLPFAAPIVGSHRIALNGYYSFVTERMRAIVNDVAYEILQVRHDSSWHVTVLSVKVVEM
jgi:hypothetical protein